MGLLADIFSTADTAKRRLSGLLADPMGTLALGVNRFGEDQGGLLNMTQNAYPMAGNKTVLNSPQQIANFRQQVADKGAEMAMQAATVWHGSPHKFDKFDSSKIGTGEGAQAYGHGLYLAESPGVAGQYQKTLSADGFLVGDKVFDPAKEIEHKNVKFWAGKGDLEGAIMTAEKIAASDSPVANIAKKDLLRLREIEAAGGISRNPGALYKVDLPDEHIAKMLDWDKPLSQQSKEVQRAIATTKTMLPPNAMDDLGGNLSLMYGPDARPQDFLNTWESFGSKAGGENALKQMGIPGIRYLDGGSRTGGAGTSNFVVFPGNEGLLNILERNGQSSK